MIPKAMLQLYAVCILISSLTIGIGSMDSGGKVETSSGGSGTLQDPYIIEDVTELQSISSNLGSHYRLKNNIDASGTATWNSGAGFLPIGTSTYKFTGSLNGNNYTISGLFIFRPSTDYVGLFGNIDATGSVKNVSIIGSNLTGRNYVGGLAGYCKGTLSYSRVSGDVHGNQYSGGLVGYCSSTVSNCNSTGKVTGSGANTGGLMGYNGGTVWNCHSIANVGGTQITGGLSGYCSGTVSNCYATGKVTGSGTNTGGLLGYHSDGIVSLSYATGKVTGSGDYVGGLAGYLSEGTVSLSYASGVVTGIGKYVGGLVGYNSDGVVAMSSASGTVTGSGNHVGGLIGYSSSVGNVSNSSAIGTVTGYGISVGGLIGHNYGLVQYGSATGDTSGNGNVGGLMGQNYGTVSNCFSSGKVTGTADNSGGLMGLNGGKVTYSHSTGMVSGTVLVGGLVGDNGGTVSHCHSTGKASGTNNIGGLGGRNGGAVSNSFSSGDASGNLFIGGLIGSNTGSVSSSYSTGNVTGHNNIGGLLSTSIGSVSNSYYNVDKVLINGGEYLTRWGLFDLQYQDWFLNGFSLKISDYSSSLVQSGDYYQISSVQGLRDLIGFAHVTSYKFRLVSDIDLSDAPGLYIPYFSGACFDGNNHEISNMKIDVPFASYAGLFGYYEGGDISNIVVTDYDVSGYRYVGGLSGYIRVGKVSNCYVTGNVIGASDYTGGLAGYIDSNTVINCHSSGKVNGSESVGGLIGTNYHGTVTNSFSITSVNGVGTKVGGLVGENIYGTVGGSFWDKQTSGQATSSSGTGLTTTEMKTKKTFTSAGWDFTNIWAIIEMVTYPFFKWEDTEFPTANAGPDQIVNEGDTVTFSGIGSSDNMGISKFTWTFTDGGSIALDGPHPSYKFDRPGVFVVTLNVTDVASQWHNDTMVVTVLDIRPPLADAGPDQIVVEGSVVTFDGSGCQDYSGIANYTWTFVCDGMVTLYGDHPTYKFTRPGAFIITLNVTDKTGHHQEDTVIVTVRDITLPFASAGEDQVVDVGTIVVFDGTASSDNSGTFNLTWTFLDMYRITLYGAQPMYRFMHPGLFIVTLQVRDADGNSLNDTMNVSVSDMTPPIAEAGPDQIVSEGTKVTFDGGGSIDNLEIVGYNWTFQYGPVKKVLGGIKVTFTFMIPGTYVVELKVFDAAGHWNTDTMTITVNDITPPVVNAGSDRTIGAGETVVLDGSLSSDNAQISDYRWTFTYDGVEQVLSGKEVSFTFGKSGIYDILLTVTDQSGNSRNNTVRITVIDTGWVKGIVIDKDGLPVEGATVTITASDGKSYTGTTKADGSFMIEVFYGSFTFEISKSGFVTISGSSTVNATGMKELDLAGQPLMPVAETNGSSGLVILIIGVLVVLIVIGIIAFILARKKKVPEQEIAAEAPQELFDGVLPTDQPATPPEEPLQVDFMSDAPPIEDNPEIPPDPLAQSISIQTLTEATNETMMYPPQDPYQARDAVVEASPEPATPKPADPESADPSTSP